MMVLPASRKTARSVTLTLDPLAAGLLNPLPRPRAIAVGLRKGGADARGVAGRDVVLLHQGVVDEVPVRVLGPDQRGHVAAAALAGPRLEQPLVRLPHAAAGLPLVDLRIPRAARVDRPPGRRRRGGPAPPPPAGRAPPAAGRRRGSAASVAARPAACSRGCGPCPR